jgi:putative transposase
MDLRERIIGAHEAGQTRPAIADRFGVNLSTVGRYIRIHRDKGTVACGKFGGHRPYALAGFEERLRSWIGACPHLTLHEIQTRLKEDEEATVSIGALFNFLRHLGLTYKKNIARC